MIIVVAEEEGRRNLDPEGTKGEEDGSGGTSLRRACSLSDLNKPNVTRRILPSPPNNGRQANQLGTSGCLKTLLVNFTKYFVINRYPEPLKFRFIFRFIFISVLSKQKTKQQAPMESLKIM